MSSPSPHISAHPFSACDGACDGSHRHDLVDFHTATRRTRLLGLWAAEIQGLNGHEAEQFVEGLVAEAVIGSAPVTQARTDGETDRVEQVLKAMGLDRDEISNKIRDFQVQAQFDVYAIR